MKQEIIRAIHWPRLQIVYNTSSEIIYLIYETHATAFVFILIVCTNNIHMNRRGKIDTNLYIDSLFLKV
jgi:hypothetical protein